MGDRLRVAFVAKAPFIGGSERSLQTTLRHLPPVGVEPVVICPPRSPIVKWCQSHQFRVEECRLPLLQSKWGLLSFWLAQRRLRRLLRTHGVMLVHSNQIISYQMAGEAGKALQIPRICHMRDDVHSGIMRLLCASGLEGAICISKYVEGKMQAGWPGYLPRPSFATLYNPIQVPAPLPAAEQSARESAARRHFQVGEDDLVFGFIGQIQAWKGLDQLLDGLATLRRPARWKLVVAGREDPPPSLGYERGCRQQVERLGLSDQVKFVGFMEDVEPFFRAVDVVIVPSMLEALGRIPLEAATYSKPAVAYATGGLPETIRHGETGWLVPTGDVAALAAILEDCARADLALMGQTAREWVQDMCDPVKYAERLRAVYDQVLGRHTGATSALASC